MRGRLKIAAECAAGKKQKKPGRFSGSGLSLSVNSIAQCVA
jgi:hypothetical protein